MNLWKSGQILCAHTPYFRRPGHILFTKKTVGFTSWIQYECCTKSTAGT